MTAYGWAGLTIWIAVCGWSAWQGVPSIRRNWPRVRREWQMYRRASRTLKELKRQEKAR